MSVLQGGLQILEDLCRRSRGGMRFYLRLSLGLWGCWSLFHVGRGRGGLWLQ